MKRNRKNSKLQNYAALLISLSFTIPLAIFVLSSFTIYKKLLYKNDLNLLERIKKEYFNEVINLQSNNYKTSNKIIKKIENLEINDALSYLKNNNDDFSYFTIVEDTLVYSLIDYEDKQKKSFVEYAKEQTNFSHFFLWENNIYMVTDIKEGNRYYIFFYDFRQPRILSNILFFNVETLYNNDEIGKFTKNYIENEFIFRQEKNIFYFKKILDIFAQPIAWTKFELKREFDLPINQTLWITVLIIIFISLIIGVLISYIITKVLFTPIEEMALEMDKKATNPKESNTIDTKKYNNLSVLVSAFNNILTSFQKSYASVEIYEYIVTNLSEGIFWADSSGKIILTNSAFDFIKKDNINFIELFDWKDMLEVFDMKEYEIDSTLYMIFVNQVKYKNEIYYIGVVSDITNQRKNEEISMRLRMELSRARRLADMGMLIEGISHNMNAPLHNVIGYAQLMKDDFPENTDIIKIIENGNRLAEILKSLLSRMSAELSSQMQFIDINDLVKLEIDFFQHNLSFKNKIEKRIKLQDNLPKIEIVYSDISQVVANLITNGIDAMEKSKIKEISIITKLVKDEINILVEDTGSGISEYLKNKIFDPFFTSKKAGGKKGYGIGLYISSELLKPYNGYITVESELNKGSKFTVHLPVGKTN